MSQRVAVAVVYVSALFMNIMDITIVNVALPAIGLDLGAPGSAIGSVSVAYLVSLAVVIPASGWAGDRFGHRRVLLVAIVLFTVASGLCGLAQSVPQLVAARALQGIGGGMLVPVGMALMMRTFPPADRVRAAAILIVPTAVAPALGPVLGGLLVTELSWRWVFWVNLPIGVVAIAFGLLFLEPHPTDRPGRFDAVGFVVSGIGFAAVMYGISEGSAKGWTSPSIVVALLVGSVLIVVLVRHQLRVRHPLLNLRLYHNRLFRLTNIAMCLAMAGFLGTLFVAALFFQDGLGMSAWEAGLMIFPEAIGVMVGSQAVSRLIYPRIGPRGSMAIGMAGTASAMLAMWLIVAADQVWPARGALFGLGFFQAFMITSSQAAAFAQVSRTDMGGATALFNAGRQLSSAAGVAVLATVIAGVAATAGAGTTLPYHVAFTVAAAFALGGIGAALRIDNADAAETMTARRLDAPAPTPG